MPQDLRARLLITEQADRQDSQTVLGANRDVKNKGVAVSFRSHDSGFLHLLQERAQIYAVEIAHRL